MEIAEARKKVLAKPLDAKALRDLGLAYATEGRSSEALDALLQAVATDSTDASLHCALGDVMKSVDCYLEAVCAYRQALQIDPRNVEAWNKLGLMAIDRKEPDLAAACLRRAVELAPKDYASRCHFARALNHKCEFEEARTQATEGLRLQPDALPARFHIVGSLCGEGDFEGAIHELKRLLATHPDNVEALGMLMQTYNNLNFAGEEVPSLARRALSLAPENACVHFELGVYSLAAGDWETGWREYEWRFKLPGHNRDSVRFSHPLVGSAWQGQELENKTLFIHCEQGLGDTLQFLRFVPELAKRGGRLILLAQPELVSLLECQPRHAKVLPFRAPAPPHDYQIPLHSVPRVLGTRMETLPSAVPYVNPPKMNPKQPPLDETAALRVGFVWSTRPLCNTDHRNAPVSAFETLFQLTSIAFYSLQINDGAKELTPYLERPNVRSLQPFIKDMRDTAGLIAQLDLVITIDTSVAHLAGVLGAQVWVLLPMNANWRWVKSDRHSPWHDKSPWYPTMRLFRSQNFNDWSAVFQSVREELLQIIASPAEAGRQILATV